MFKFFKTRESRIRERISYWEDESFMWTFKLGIETSFEEQRATAWNLICTERLINRLYKKLNRR